ncbi:MAG: sulfurtransferase [Verrucomicrobiales bacterium]
MIGLAGGLLAGCRRSEPVGDLLFPARGVPRYEALVSASWVRAAQAYARSNGRGERPETMRHDRLVVVEADWVPEGKSADYDREHIPGAVLMNTEDLDTGYPQWRLRDLPSLHEAIGRAGISEETTVVVYGRQTIAAARVWWVLGYAGVRDVRMMDGGTAAWKAAGHPVESERVTPSPVHFEAAPRDDWLVTTDQVRTRLNDPAVCFADVRSAEEFTGLASGYQTLLAKGRLPGALHLGEATDGSPQYFEPDGRLRAPTDVLALWKQQGLVPTGDGRRFGRDVVFYCGGGWRSSLSFFYAWLLGFDGIGHYADGWVAWSTRFEPDPDADGPSPGWTQSPTGNPFDPGSQ